jgi:Zn-dependent alcohol dehydrogenase
MAISVHGVVVRGKGEPVEVTEVLVPEPGPGEALVRTQACGVCHTDLHLDGRLPLEKFVSETIALGDVEDAFAKMEHGDVLRSVVVF